MWKAHNYKASACLLTYFSGTHRCIPLSCLSPLNIIDKQLHLVAHANIFAQDNKYLQQAKGNLIPEALGSRMMFSSTNRGSQFFSKLAVWGLIVWSWCCISFSWANCFCFSLSSRRLNHFKKKTNHHNNEKNPVNYVVLPSNITKNTP